MAATRRRGQDKPSKYLRELPQPVLEFGAGRGTRGATVGEARQASSLGRKRIAVTIPRGATHCLGGLFAPQSLLHTLAQVQQCGNLCGRQVPHRNPSISIAKREALRKPEH